jgi:hypothetical protein
MAGEGTAGRWFMGAAFVVVAVAIAASIYFLVPKVAASGGDPSASPSSTPTPPPNGGGVPEEQNEDAVDPGPVDSASVTPFITGAVLAADGSSVTVYSFVPGLTEAGGVCRASVVGGGPAEIAEGIATADVAETTCPPLVIPLAGAAEDLTVQVTYESATSSGTSESVGVDG